MKVRLDGSGSTDDLAIARWQWSRDPESLAAGTVVGNMTSPQLVLANLVPGTYSFNLQVQQQLDSVDAGTTSPPCSGCRRAGADL